MRKLLFIVLVVFLATGSSFAKKGGDSAAKLQKEIKTLTTELSLTTDQAAKVTTILTDAQKQESEASKKMSEAGGEMDKKEMRKEKNKLAAETDKKIKAVLTDEQGVKFDAYRIKQAEERKNKGKKKN